MIVVRIKKPALGLWWLTAPAASRLTFGCGTGTGCRFKAQGLQGIKLGQVVPLGNLHEDGFLSAFQFVVLLQFLPESVDLNSDDRIRLGIEVRLSAESLDANRVLLDFIGMRFQSPGGQKPEQLLQRRCALKGL